VPIYSVLRPLRSYFLAFSELVEELDVQQCHDYEDLIFLNLKKRETRHPPLGRYLRYEDTDITADHRAMMINWLVDVSLHVT
jgi:hypothetical protein